MIINQTLYNLLHPSVEGSYWTIPTPSSTSYIVYVSEDGDDSTGATYADGVFTNVFEPDFEPSAYATFATAYEQVRDGYADYVLFKRGDTFYEGLGSLTKSGISETERFVIGAYGTSGDSPLFKTGAELGVSSYNQQMENLYVLGLSFYAHTRDPESDDYTGIMTLYDYAGDEDGEGVPGSVGFAFSNGTDGFDADNITLEGCRFNYYNGNSATLDYYSTCTLHLELRRCVILNSYTSYEGGHCQGFWGSEAKVTMDECIMDYNGWYSHPADDDVGEATMFNHNIYFAGCHDTTFSNCIFARGSSINNKFTGYPGDEDSSPNIVLDNNFYLGGEIAIQIGGNYSDADTYGGNYRFKDLEITNNVIQDAGWENPLGRQLGWGLYLEGTNSAVVNDNLVTFTNSELALTNSYCLVLKDGYTKGMSLDSNVFSSNTGGASLFYADPNTGEATDDITFTNNIFNAITTDVDYIGFIRDDHAWSFANNWYYTPRTTNEFWVGDSYQMDDWLVNFDTTATVGTAPYVFTDDTKTVETYMGSLGYTATKDGFLGLIDSQDRYSWDENLTTNNINNWIKSGWVGE